MVQITIYLGLLGGPEDNDINPNLSGDQKATFLNSIGFGLVDENKLDPTHPDHDPNYTLPDTVAMLREAADVGGGDYRDASIGQKV